MHGCYGRSNFLMPFFKLIFSKLLFQIGSQKIHKSMIFWSDLNQTTLLLVHKEFVYCQNGRENESRETGEQIWVMEMAVKRDQRRKEKKSATNIGDSLTPNFRDKEESKNNTRIGMWQVYYLPKLHLALVEEASIEHLESPVTAHVVSHLDHSRTLLAAQELNLQQTTHPQPLQLPIQGKLP